MVRVPGTKHGVDGRIAVCVGVAAFALVLATLGAPAVTWDEGFTIRREALVRGWFTRLVSPPQGVSRGQLFQESALETFWPFAREEPDGHPPFYALVGNAGWRISHTWLDPLEAHRFGPALLFSSTAAVMYWFLSQRWGRLAGLTAAGTWLLTPRVFAHGHLASYDIPLACLWFLSVVAFWKAREVWPRSPRAGWRWSGMFAAVLAMSAATKFTGWLIPLPLLAWSMVAGLVVLRREGAPALRAVIPIVVLLVPWAVKAPEVMRLAGEAARIESSLEGSPEFRDAQQRSARAAELLRRDAAGSVPLVVLFIPVAAWLLFTIALRFRPGCLDSMGFGPLSAVWTSAAALAPPVTIALCPPWWPDPMRGIAIFLWSNLSRQKTTWIPTQFFGTLYEFSLPWYNSLAWVALTMPAGLLLLVLLGIVATVVSTFPAARAVDSVAEPSTEQRGSSNASDPSAAAESQGTRGLGWLMLLNGATLIIIRALPGSPGHDGERQLLGSFPFLACLAGLGARWLQVQLGRFSAPALGVWFSRIVVACSLISAGAGIWHYRRAPLSYYTELVGGLRGAAGIGLEPTYYWDALDGETIRWLNEHTPAGSTVLFCNDFLSLHYLRQWGSLRPGLWPHDQGVPRWYVLQNRPGLFAEKPWDQWLAESGRAAFVHELDGVPLIWVFSFEEYDKARRQFERSAAGS